MNLDAPCTVLPNGLTVATSAIPQVESVAMGLWIRSGGRHEPARLSGVGHFIEHLLFKGTASRSGHAISREIEGRGGYINAYTQEESTCLYARVAENRAWEVFDILVEMVRHPRMAPRDIENERRVILDEIRMYRDQPSYRVHEYLDELLWQGHALGRSLTGSEAAVARLGRADLLAWKNARYVPANMMVVFAGRVDHAACVERVRAAWSGARRGRGSTFRRVNEATRQGRLRVESRDTEQANLAMAFRVFGRNHPQRFALKLLSILLGESMSSRLFNQIRERRGLAYSIQSEVNLLSDTGTFGIQAGMDPARAPAALRLIFNQLHDVRARAVRPAELRLAKDYAIGQLRIGMESTTDRLMWLGENLAALSRAVQPGEMIDALQAVTPDDILAVAREHLAPARLSAAMIAPSAPAVLDRALSNGFVQLEG